MFRRLLVPLDGTPQSASALPLARVLARASGGRLILVRVVEDWKLSPDERTEQPLLVLEQLRRIAEELHASGLEVDVQVSSGEVVPEVLRMADAEHADALVVATHASRLERLVGDSTTGQLVARSALPIVVIRPGGRRAESLRTLLAAVDGTPGGAQALDEATQLARLTGAALVLVRVIQPHGSLGFDPLLGPTLGAQSAPGADAEALAAAEGYVDEMTRRLREHGIVATPRVMVGQPAERIVKAAEQVDADLIVMSTHGYLAPLRSLLGSTADEVVRSAGRPVLLVRRIPSGMGHLIEPPVAEVTVPRRQKSATAVAIAGAVVAGKRGGDDRPNTEQALDGPWPRHDRAETNECHLRRVNDAEDFLRHTSAAAITDVVLLALGRIAPEADLSALNPTADIREQLDIDSVDFLNFVLAIHQKLGIDIPEADYGKLRSLESCIAYLGLHQVAR